MGEPVGIEGVVSLAPGQAPGGPEPLKVLRVLTASSTFPDVANSPRSDGVLCLDIDCACADRDSRPPLRRRFLRSSVAQVFEALKRESPRVVHCLSGTAATAWVEVLDAAGLRLPLVVSLTGRDLGRLCRPDSESLRLRRALRAPAWILVESEEALREVVRQGLPRDRTLKVARGVPIADIEPSGPRSDASRALDPRFHLLIAGPLVERQGLAILLEAAARLARKPPGLRLTLIGTGPLLRPLRSLIEHLGIASSVNILNRPMPRGHLLALGSTADVFVAPNITAKDGDREAGAPTGLLLAMATALPVVATRHAGIPELVEDGETGFLAEERDLDGLVSALARVRNAPERAREIGRNARARIEREHDLPQQDEALGRVYVSVADA